MHLSDMYYARLLRKFKENSFEKLDRLVEMHNKYLRAIEASEANENGGTIEEKYEQRLDKGLFTLQQIDLIIGLLCTAGETGMKERFEQVLNQHDSDLNDVKKILSEYLVAFGDSRETKGSVERNTLSVIVGELQRDLS